MKKNEKCSRRTEGMSSIDINWLRNMSSLNFFVIIAALKLVFQIEELVVFSTYTFDIAL